MSYRPLFFLMSLLWSMPALAQMPGRGSGAELGGEIFLVEDKTLAGLDFSGMGTDFGFHLNLDLMYADSKAERSNLDDDFIGTFLGGHIFYRSRITQMFEGRLGTGIDVFFLSGIASGERKIAWPFYGELNAGVSRNIAVFLRTRYHLLSSDGLLVGENFDGDTGAPFLSSVGVSYVF